MYRYKRIISILFSFLVILLIFSSSSVQDNNITFNTNSCKTFNTGILEGGYFSCSSFSQYTNSARICIFNRYVYNNVPPKGANIIESIQIYHERGDKRLSLEHSFNFTITDKEIYGTNVNLEEGRYEIVARTIVDYYNKSDFLNNTLSEYNNTIIMTGTGFSVVNYYEIITGIALLGMLIISLKKSRIRILP